MKLDLDYCFLLRLFYFSFLGWLCLVRRTLRVAGGGEFTVAGFLVGQPAVTGVFKFPRIFVIMLAHLSGAQLTLLGFYVSSSLKVYRKRMSRSETKTE